MGTRNLTIVTLGGVNRVAQYGQWDGYPKGQGKTVHTFLTGIFNREKFIKALDNTYFATEEEFDQMIVEAGAEAGSEWMSMDINEKMDELYPSVHRDTGANILELIQEGKYTIVKFCQMGNKWAHKEITRAVKPGRIPLSDESDYLKHAEWVYQVNLDTNELVVFGWGDTTVNGVRQPLKRYPLNALPDFDTFCEELDPKENDEK